VTEEKKKTHVPSALKRLVSGHQNTSRYMVKLWMWVVAALCVLLPLGFLAQGHSVLSALVSGMMLWLFLGIVSRCLVYGFHRFRAGQVADVIDRRIPSRHGSRDAVMEWITHENHRGYLNALLEKLGAPLWKTQVSYSPLNSFDDLPIQVATKNQTQTQGYTVTSQTQVWKDGEWVTVESSSSGDGGGLDPEALIAQAMASMQGMTGADTSDATSEPPPGFEPIPIGPTPEKSVKKEKKRKKRRKDRRQHMPLELDAFDPEAAASDEADDAGKRDAR
jgi:hypothetical protein